MVNECLAEPDLLAHTSMGDNSVGLHMSDPKVQVCEESETLLCYFVFNRFEPQSQYDISTVLGDAHGLYTVPILNISV